MSRQTQTQTQTLGLPHCAHPKPSPGRADSALGPPLQGGSRRAGPTPPSCSSGPFQRAPENISKALCVRPHCPVQPGTGKVGQGGRETLIVTFYVNSPAQRGCSETTLGCCTLARATPRAERGPCTAPKRMRTTLRCSSSSFLLPPQQPVVTDTPHQQRVLSHLLLALQRGLCVQQEVSKTSL